MTSLYQLVGVSRQAHQQMVSKQARQDILEAEVVTAALQLRKRHPRMGIRKMYEKLQPVGMGRDRFESLLVAQGFRLSRKRNYHRTTYSCLPWQAYDNHITGLTLTGKNQLWVSDITYVRCGEEYLYLFLILDVYSRKVVGWHVSDRLKAEGNVQALKMALRGYKSGELAGLIHHSDRGSQYIYQGYTQLLHHHGIRISMGNKAWENAHAERINGILKNEYILEQDYTNLEELVKVTRKSVSLYNQERPHWNLPGRLSPTEFEKSLRGVPPEGKPSYLVEIKY